MHLLSQFQATHALCEDAVYYEAGQGMFQRFIYTEMNFNINFNIKLFLTLFLLFILSWEVLLSH